MNAKAAMRREAATRRAVAAAGTDQHPATEHLDDELKPFAGRPVSFYMPMRSEIDPRPAMVRTVLRGPVLLPVVVAPQAPLAFRRWQPGARMVCDSFGIEHPCDEAEEGVPHVLVVPLLAFDARGRRLGYGGGFYDRTLAALRAAAPVFAIGFAFAAQEVDAVPTEAFDQPLDAVVTERGVRRFD